MCLHDTLNQSQTKMACFSAMTREHRGRVALFIFSFYKELYLCCPHTDKVLCPHLKFPLTSCPDAPHHAKTLLMVSYQLLCECVLVGKPLHASAFTCCTRTLRAAAGLNRIVSLEEVFDLPVKLAPVWPHFYFTTRQTGQL